MHNYLDFEKPIIDLESKINDLKNHSSNDQVDLSEQIKQLEEKSIELTKEIFSNLTPWQKVQLARHPLRPYTLDYIKNITDSFDELHGDRLFMDDRSIISGIGTIDKEPVVIIGQQKGRNMEDNIFRNFGMPNPEGYRKSLRIMKLAEKFNLPIVTFIDTPGAYPGIGAEERGQAEAIARNLREMSVLKVPIIVIVIGEGGSGGALAIGVGDTIVMLEYTIYSVISPEGCASILWRDASLASTAAGALKLTPEELLSLNVIDKIINEPLGGAHRNPLEISKDIKKFILSEIKNLKGISIKKLLDDRYKKLRNIGKYKEIN
jgi:acetyl-CoA carboxylase carboxyl transferase subunit alpha